MKVEIKSEIFNLQTVRAFWSDNVPFAQGSNELIYITSLTLKGRRREIESERATKLYELNPKPEDLIVNKLFWFLKKNQKGWTRVCCIKLGWFAIGSEKLFDFGYSWFSAKAIKVVCFNINNLGKVIINLGGIF